MKRYFLIFVVLGLIFLTACNLTPPDSQPVLDMTPIETEIASPSPDVQTPLAAATQPGESLTPTVVPSTWTATPQESTSTPEPPTQPPALTPTKQLMQKPTATPHLLGLQIGSPARLSNFAHPELGCQWLGLAGQVFDGDGLPLENLVVEVGGSIAGQPAIGLAVTGSSDFYGPGSYEIKLADAPLSSNGTAWVRVYGLDGLPLSAPVYFSTSTHCSENLILLNFVQSYTLPDNWVYLPLIVR